MASSKKKIGCSVCKLKFDEDHGVWVCLDCTEKLTNAINQASESPHPPHRHYSASPKSSHQQQQKQIITREQRRSSLPSELSSINKNSKKAIALAMTLFLELTNNGNKRRFKYKPNDIHKNCSIIEIKEYLLRRFSHDVNLTKLSISNECEFEINDSYHQHQFIIFESLTDLFDGSKIKITINKYYYNKYNKEKTNISNINAASNKLSYRRRSKSTSSITDDMKWNACMAKDEEKKPLSIIMNSNINKLKADNSIISPTVNRLGNYASFGNIDTSNSANNENNCVIIDNGSGLIKCGFGYNLSEHNAPHGPNIIFPNAYYRNKNNKIEIGNKAIQICDKLNMNYIKPINRGFITNWNEMEYIWNNILFNKLNINENEIYNYSLLMTERYNTPIKQREKLLEIIFENFNISSLYLKDSSSLSIYGTGRTKGIVLDIGHDCTSIITIDGNENNNKEINNNNNNNNNKVIEFGGYDISIDLMKEYKINSFFHANKIKEDYYSVPYERSDILFADQNNEIYKLPDGREIKLGKNRMIKPLHLLFDKSINNKYGINVSKLVSNCILLNGTNDKNIKNLLWKNIVLSGGTTMMNGFAEKFAKEIKHLCSHTKTQVIAGRSRKHLSWVGAVVMSSISTFKNISISRKMYNQHGPRVIREMKL